MTGSEGGLLSADEETTIKNAWAVCAIDTKGVGSQLFINFFIDYPQYHSKFPRLASIPIEQLFGNKRLEAHELTVMKSIDGLVDNLVDPEVLDELLYKIGVNHGKRHIVVGDFQNLKTSLLRFFAKTFGDEWSGDANNAWDKLLDVMVTKIGQGLITDDNES